jgi:hypothetical protein
MKNIKDYDSEEKATSIPEYFNGTEFSKIIKYYDLFEPYFYIINDDGEKLPMAMVSVNNQQKVSLLIENGYTLDKLKKDFEGLPFEWVFRILTKEEN